VRICHVSERLPPESGASAIQPVQVAAWCLEAGDEVRFVSCRPRQPAGARPQPLHALPGAVSWVTPADHGSGPGRLLWTAHAAGAAWALRAARPDLQWADVVHVHGGSTIAEAGALLAMRLHKPVLLTLYGREVRSYRRTRWWTSAFGRAYRAAAHVTFTSHGLLARAIERGLARRDATVVYPPVAPVFGRVEEPGRAAARLALGIRARHLLVCVRALDDSGGHPQLIEALSDVIRTHPDTRLVLIGTGPALPALKAAARAWGVEGHVTFAGRVDHDVVARYDVAADAFVLPSAVEGVAVAALEALASGSPVITADSDGGRELHELFGSDVSVVLRDNAAALAGAIVHALEEKRRVRGATSELIDREHRCDTSCAQYRDIYARVLSRGVPDAARR
jgi:glycosyltransferase involved in cell wall biosynthesis